MRVAQAAFSTATAILSAVVASSMLSKRIEDSMIILPTFSGQQALR